MKFVCSLIVVKDMKIAKRFYEEVLEQKVQYDFGENVAFEGGFALHLEEHYMMLLGKKTSTVTRKSDNFELYFETDNIERTYEKVKTNNVEFIHELREQPWGQRVTRFYDPDFHIVEVGETMESVVIRFYKKGMDVKEISIRTSMPEQFVSTVISSLSE